MKKHTQNGLTTKAPKAYCANTEKKQTDRTNTEKDTEYVLQSP